MSCELPGQVGLCVQETQSPLMGTLSVDQLLSYDGFVGSYGREACFLLHSTIVASPTLWTRDLQFRRWRRISGSLCVCSFHASQAGIATDTRIQFWRKLAASVHRVSQLHSGVLLLAWDSNISFPFFLISRQDDAPFLPILQELAVSQWIVVVPLWTSFSLHQFPRATSLSGLVPTAVDLHLSVAPCLHRTTCCVLVISTFPSLFVSQLSKRSLVNWGGTSLSLPTFHAHADFPGRVSTLGTLFNSLTHILFDGAALHSRRRPTVSRPRRKQPLWSNDACYHARHGSLRDFRRSGSQKDQARFRCVRQQFHSTVRSSRTHF